MLAWATWHVVATIWAREGDSRSQQGTSWHCYHFVGFNLTMTRSKPMKAGDTVEEGVHLNCNCKIIRACEGSGNEVVFDVKFLHNGSVHSRHVRKLKSQKQLPQQKTNTPINKPLKTPQLNIVASDSSSVTMSSLLSSTSLDSSFDATYSSPGVIGVPIWVKCQATSSNTTCKVLELLKGPPESITPHYQFLRDTNTKDPQFSSLDLALALCSSCMAQHPVECKGADEFIDMIYKQLEITKSQNNAPDSVGNHGSTGCHIVRGCANTNTVTLLSQILFYQV